MYFCYQRFQTLLLAAVFAFALVLPTLAQTSQVQLGFEEELSWLSTSAADVTGMGDALSCSINTSCPEASSWTDPARATVMVIRDGNANSACSGVLLNNTLEDGTPYVLTAHHCGTPSPGQSFNWTIRFSYDSPTCGNTSPPTYYEATGVTAVAASESGDYALLRIDGEMPADYTLFFAGWSIEDVAPPSSITIGHPMQDVKKIAFDDDALKSYFSPIYWEARFDRGTVESGSSGGPLFNDQQQVIGQVKSSLAGTLSSCTGDPGSNTARILFPKLSYVWNVGASGERVSDFLDPSGSGVQSMGGLSGTGAPPPPPPPPPAESDLWINEVNANADNRQEFIEMVGVEGLSMDGYEVAMYSCSAGTTTLLRTETMPDFTFPNESQGFGFFVLAGTSVDVSTASTTFSGNNVLADGSGLIVVRDAAGNEVFDYQYDSQTGGTPDNCPNGRATRSEVDAVQDGTMGFTMSRAATATDLGVNTLTASPGLSNSDGGQLLPVELISFEAVVDGGDVVLRWATASETNNAGFEIQRTSTRPNWEAMGWIDGRGTTVEAQEYGYRVSDLEAGVYRFRLKQIDYDGTSAYSPEVEVAVDLREVHRLTAAYPNPFSSQTSFSLTVGHEQHVTVAVYNMLGRRVAVLHNDVLPASSARALRFDGTGLANGVYVLQVTGERFADRQMITLVQ